MSSSDQTEECSSSDALSQEKELHIRQFLVLTVYNVFSKTGAINLLNDLGLASNINRLVKLTRSKLRLPADRIPKVKMCDTVAHHVSRELKKKFLDKAGPMLLLPQPRVELIINNAFQTHITNEMMRKSCSCKAIVFSLLAGSTVIIAIGIAVCVYVFS